MQRIYWQMQAGKKASFKLSQAAMPACSLKLCHPRPTYCNLIASIERHQVAVISKVVQLA